MLNGFEVDGWIWGSPADFAMLFAATTDQHTDNNGDGVTYFVDLGLLKTFFLGPPGPSASGCN